MMQDIPSYSPPKKFDSLKWIRGGYLNYIPR